jgi:hypothetical protein
MLFSETESERVREAERDAASTYTLCGGNNDSQRHSLSFHVILIVFSWRVVGESADMRVS